jgi:hypothetical protein
MRDDGWGIKATDVRHSLLDAWLVELEDGNHSWNTVPNKPTLTVQYHSLDNRQSRGLKTSGLAHSAEFFMGEKSMFFTCTWLLS